MLKEQAGYLDERQPRFSYETVNPDRDALMR